MESASVITGALILGAAALKATDLVKYLISWLSGPASARPKALNGLLTLIITAVAGVLLVALFAKSEFASQVKVGKAGLDELSFGSQVWFGLVVSSFASTLHDLKKAVDSSDTASTPAIVGSVEEERLQRQAQFFSQS